jgi:hypothetical protein
VKLVALQPTTATWEKLLAPGVERSTWMPSAPETLAQYKVTAETLVAAVNDAKTYAEIEAANLRVGV